MESIDRLNIKKNKYNNALSKIDNVKSKLIKLEDLLSNKNNFDGLTYISDSIDFLELALNALDSTKVNLKNTIYKINSEIKNSVINENVVK